MRRCAFVIRRLASRVAALAVLAVLAACDDDPSQPTIIAATNAVVAVNTGTVAAVDGEEFTFANAGAVFAPALAGQDVRLTFATSGATPQATIVFAGGGQVVANVSFGSCIFVVASSSFPTAHPLGIDQRVTVDPCHLNVGTGGQPADGAARQRNVSLRLAGATSRGKSVSITVNRDGTFTINGTSAGTVTLVRISA